MNEKLAVVTGGTKGIGRAIVEVFAKNNFSIATCARGEADLIQLKEAMGSTYQTKIHTFPADLAKREVIDEFLDFVGMIGKEIHVLINNTGVFVPGQIQDEEEGVLEKLMSTNIYSAYHITRGLMAKMKETPASHIFNICSTASITPYTSGASYCISKFALYGFSKVLREELKNDGVRVTSVLPGATLTPSWDGVEIPEGRIMEAKDIAESIWSAYSLSPQTVVEDILIRPQLGDL